MAIRYLVALLLGMVPWTIAAQPIEKGGAVRANSSALVHDSAIRHGSAPPAGVSSDSSSFRSDRFWAGVGAMVLTDAVVMHGLNRLWYAEHERTSFHWYDDWETYVQQDKGGHLFVAWHLARLFGEYGLWSGMTRKQAGLFGGAMSALFQSQIEFFDGFSEAFGASRTDILANVVGGAIGGAKIAWPDRLSWVTAKYSYHPSPYYDAEASSIPPFRFLGNALKDYDGISYWLVMRPSDRYDGWPEWLGLSVGYSGTGLAHPLSGRDPFGGHGGPEHRRQLFIGPDLDLLALRHEWPQPFRAIAGFFSFVRIPAPAIQLTPELRWFWTYY